MEQRHQADKRDMEMKLELDKVKADADRKLDIEKAKAEMDRKLMESKIQQQAVDMQQNLVMSMPHPRHQFTLFRRHQFRRCQFRRRQPRRCQLRRRRYFWTRRSKMQRRGF